MVNQTQTQAQDPMMQQILQDTLTQIGALQQEQRTLAAKPDKTADDNLRQVQIPQEINAARQTYASLYSTIKQTQTTPLQTAGGLAGIASQDFQNRSSVADQNLKIAAMFFENELGMAGLAKGLLGMYEESKQAAVNQQIAREGLNLHAVQAIEEAKAAQFTAALGQSAAILAQQKYIDETRFRNFERMLPPGTTEVPAFGKNDPIGQALGRLGIAYGGMKATPVDWEKLDPGYTYGEARGRVPELPNFTTAGIEDAAARIGGIQTYQPTQYGMADVGDPMRMRAAERDRLSGLIPQAPDMSQYIAMLMGGGSGVPGVASGYTDAQSAQPTAIDRARRESPPGEEPSVDLNPPPGQAPAAMTAPYGSPWQHSTPPPQPAPVTQQPPGPVYGTNVNQVQVQQNPFDFLLKPRQPRPQPQAVQR